MKKIPKVLWLILALALVLRIWNIAGPDISGDDATYSFRSIGYIDFIAAANRQSTPVNWFPSEQWWQPLSFHDAPPLVFALQHFSFEIFGDNAYAARLPFVAIGLLAVYAAYLLGEYLIGLDGGLIAAGIMAITNYPVWLSRIGFLDGVTIPAILFAIYFFLKAQKDPRYYRAWGAACAAGLLTKYTFLFLGPAFFIGLMLWQRSALRKKEFYQGLAILLALLSPVIVYNTMMFMSRGHFDAALSTLIGQRPADFSGLIRTKNGNVLDIIGQFFSGQAFSFFMIICAAIGAFAFSTNATTGAFALLTIGIAGAIAELAVIGEIGRFGAILIPFIVIFSAMGVKYIFDRAKRYKLEKTAIAGFALIAAIEIMITIQSQLLPQPLFAVNSLTSTYHAPWDGYEALENYIADFYALHNNVSPILTYQNDGQQIAHYQKNLILHSLTGNENTAAQDQLVIYDERMNWFASLWTFERRRLYKAEPIHSLWQFLENTKGGADLSFYKNFGIKTATIVIATDAMQQNQDIIHKADVDAFAAQIRSVLQPTAEIRDEKNDAVFLIYTIKIQ